MTLRDLHGSATHFELQSPSHARAQRNQYAPSFRPAILPPMKSVIRIAVLALFLPLAACKSDERTSTDPSPAPSAERAATTSATADFDYYLLNLSWSPEFCYSHPNAAECAAHSRFVLHGLWPQNFNGTYPENCSNARGPAAPSSFNDIYPDRGLLEHEWRTHGTCSGLTSDVFFTTARVAYRSIVIPQKLQNLTRQTSMSPSQIMNLFMEYNPKIPRESLAISCGNNYLTAVEICLDKSLRPIQCGPVRSCKSVIVRIPPPR